MRLKNLVALVALMLVAGGLLISWRVRLKRAAELAQYIIDRNRHADVPVEPDDPRWGSSVAPVTIAIFGDLQSPFLAPVWPILEQVKSEYGPDKVRIVWKNRPALFHPEARPAARAAQAVYLLKGSDAHWSFVATALRNQSDLGPAAYERWAAAAGVDVAAFRAKSASPEVRARVEAKPKGLFSTSEEPVTVYVNGLPPIYLKMDAFSPTAITDYRSVIDEQLQLARTILEVPPYASISQANREREAKRDRQGGMRAIRTPTPVELPIGASPVRGPANAIVTVVVLSDFTSPQSKNFARQMRQDQTKYGDKIRVVWKHRPLPFDPRAEPAAELALEAQSEKGNDGFWLAHDKLFESPTLERADLERIAGELGLDMNAVRLALDERRHRPRIDADQRLAMRIERDTRYDEASFPRFGTLDGGITPLVAVNTVPVHAGDGPLGYLISAPYIGWEIDAALDRFTKEHGTIEAREWYAHLLAKIEAPSRDTTGMWNDGIRLAGDLTAHGPDVIPRGPIVEALATAQAPMKACHAAALAANPFARGRVIVEVLIDGSGKVLVVQDGGSSLPDPAALRCVREAIHGVTFPSVPTQLFPFAALFTFEAPT